MSAAPEVAKAGAARTAPTAVREAGSARAHGLAARLRDEWLQRIAWSVSRTGRPGLVGIALLLAATLFLASTYVAVAAEVDGLRADLAAAQRRARPAGAEKVAERVVDPAAAIRALPAREDMPAILRRLFDQATRARLTVDTARYDIGATKGSGVVRHQIAFPLTGPYPQIRAFIDATLAAMPEVALGDLVLERRSIGDGNVEAQIRMTIYTRSAR